MANYFNTLSLRQQLDQLGRCRFMARSEFTDGCEFLKGKKVVIVGCSIKNQIAFSDELSYENYLSNTEKRYLANKNHCKDNFVEFCKKSNQSEKIKTISNKVLKDVGDAFMMGYSWIVRNF